MMKHRLIAILALATLISCDRPECRNSNPVLDRYAPTDKRYKDELVRQLKKTDSAKLTYRMDKYFEQGGKQYLQVNMQGDGLCAKGIITVQVPDAKIAGICKAKGMGYRGAALVGLQYTIYQREDTTELIYAGLHSIID